MITTDKADYSARFLVIITVKNPISSVTWAIVGGASVAIVVLAIMINSAGKNKRKKKQI